MTENPRNHSLAADRLRSIVERIEKLDEERRALSSDIRDIFTEAKSAGFDPKALRQVLALRRKSREEAEMLEHLVQVYCNALGM